LASDWSSNFAWLNYRNRGCSASYLWVVDRIPLFRIGWVETLETVLPQLIKAGVITEEIDIDALKANIADEVQEARLQVVGPAQICAWIRV
jgi:hypothetical protein